MVSKLIVGPNRDIPLAMLVLTSSCVDAHRANSASFVAFDKSISNKKKNKASLEQKKC